MTESQHDFNPDGAYLAGTKWVWNAGKAEVGFDPICSVDPFSIAVTDGMTVRISFDVTELQQLRAAIGKALKARKQYGESREAASDE